MFSESGAILQLDEERFFVAGNLSAACLPDFFAEFSIKACRSSEFEILSRSELILRLSEGIPFETNWQEPSKESFSHFFDESQQLMQKSELKKVVPVVFAETQNLWERENWNYSLRLLLEKQRMGFIYSYWDSDSGVLGCTPETLFYRKKDTIKTMALAGTRPKEDSARVSLLEDEKELSEHKIVIENITENLKNFGEVSCGETSIISHASLEHLKTPISIEVKDETNLNVSQLLKVLHPTPALGGEPRNVAVALLKRWDQQVERKSFGAPFTVLLPNETLSVVAIRNIQWSKKSVRIGSGCGLVVESQLLREWDELQKKRDSVKQMLGIA